MVYQIYHTIWILDYLTSCIFHIWSWKMINCLSNISALHSTLLQSCEFNMNDIQNLGWSGLKSWTCGQRQRLDSMCVALGPGPCKGEKVFWNLLVAFSNAIRHWGEVLTGGDWDHYLLLCVYEDLPLLFLPSCIPHFSPRFLSFVNTFLKPQMWIYKWVRDEMNARLPPSPSPNTEHCHVIFHSLIDLCNSKEDYFLGFAYPDFQTSPGLPSLEWSTTDWVGVWVTGMGGG